MKNKAVQYLPKKLDSIAAQKEILQMISAAISPVKACEQKAELEIWPDVKNNKLLLEQAVAWCAYEVEKIVSITVIEKLDLKSLSVEALCKTWISLDYYAHLLKADRAVHIVKLQNYISSIVTAKESKVITSGVQEYGVTQAIPVNRPTSAAASPGAHKQLHNPSKADEAKHKKTGHNKAGKGISVVSIILLLAAVLILAPVFSAVAQTERAIEKIGEVTIDSRSVIEEAEALYNELSEADKEKVENYDLLVAAREELDHLNELIQNAKDLISAIGTVTVESKESIHNARKAYNTLVNYNLTQHVADEYPILIQAEEVFERCYIQYLYDSAIEQYERGLYEEAKKCYETIIIEYSHAEILAECKAGIVDCVASLAQKEMDADNLESAMKMLTDIADQYSPTSLHRETVKNLETKLEKIRPKNGKKFHDSVGWGRGSFTVVASFDKDALVKLVSVKDPSQTITFYVRAGEEHEEIIKHGTYICKYATGLHWYGEKQMFGDDTEFTQFDEELEFTNTQRGNSVYFNEITLSLFMVTEDSAGLSKISAEDF